MRRACADNPGWRCSLVLIGAWALAAASAALAGPGPGVPPNYGYEFVTIGAVGNRATLPHEVPTRPTLQIGAVNYQYRIAKTEVTGADWFEFVQAYAPYIGDNFGDQAFFSSSVVFVGFGPGNVPAYSMNPVHNDQAVQFGWRYAARYCNWLTNGKALTRDAFERGAYDTSTFTTNPDGTINDQLAHSPGALYWIPTRDEWVKATYYDPNKHGPEIEGYWRHPGGQDTPLISGAPGTPGAQTPSGVQMPGFYPDVGSYPDVNAPWGLLDTSGGQMEWTETGVNHLVGGRRVSLGSFTGQSTSAYELFDRIEHSLSQISGPGGLAGMRLASSVPEPATFSLILGATLVSQGGRRRAPVPAERAERTTRLGIPTRG